jgi:hypothetical protein
MRMALGVIAATCATPLAIAAMFGALHFFQVGWFGERGWSLVQDSILLYAAFSAPVAFFLIIAAGGPLAHRLAHLGHTGFRRHAVAGVILGATPFILFDGYVIGTNFLLDVRPAPDINTVKMALRWAALGAWCGLWSAGAYWVVVIRRSPVR